MRLFVAIALPAEVKKYLQDLQKQLPQKGVSLARHFHLTLQFLGECDDIRKEKIIEALRGVSTPPFELRLGQPGSFGSNSIARVFWISIDSDPALFDLQRAVAARLRKCGFVPEKQKFFPHLTLARARDPRAGAELHTVQLTKLRQHTVVVHEFALFRSHLSPHGASYEILAWFK